MQFQIVSPNPERSAEFYCSLFGWEINADNPMGYRAIDTSSGRGINGGVWPAPPEASSFVQLFMEVPDVSAAVAQATAMGAQVIVPPSHLPGGDVMAVLRDPEGMAFAVQSVPPGRTTGGG
jgi:predicted enzyme related to lactoylglutathione lyase